jgi:glycosyltransferase involved in cell wall biosynthesis
MRIGVFISAAKNSGGIYQYSSSILKALNNWDTDNEFAIIKFPRNKLPLEAQLGYNWSELTIDPSIALNRNVEQHLSGDGLDLIHPGINPKAEAFFKKHHIDFLIFPAPSSVAFEWGLPYIMAIHDLQHRLQPQFPEVSAGNIWKSREYLFRNGVRYAEAIMVDSEVGKEDVLYCYGDYITPDRIYQLPYLPFYQPDSVEKNEIRKHQIQKKYDLPKNFLFYPAQFWLHKNHSILIYALYILRTVHKVDIPLVLVGSNSGGPKEEAREYVYKKAMILAEQLGVKDLVRYLGYIPDEDMPFLYAMAKALTMPTFFGPTNIPFLEAWAFGCPVITSDIRGIREQVGDAGLLVDPKNAVAMAEGILKIGSDQDLRNELINRGYTRANSYTSNNFAAKLYTIIEDVKHQIQVNSKFSCRNENDRALKITDCKADSENYLVSAIVSTYNSEKYLRGCLEDLKAQTISDQLEIVVVDSGSEQNEGAIVKEFQKKYSNIKYIKTENRETVYQAWNRGIKAASGKYITNANTDDRLHPDAMNRLAKTLETRHDVDIVYADSLITRTENANWKNPRAPRIFKWPDYNYRLLFDVCFLGPNPMWRKSLHEKHGYFDESYKSAGDYEFWLRIAKHGTRMLHLREALSLYLENPKSISLSQPSISWEESERARNSHWPPEWGKRPPTRWRSFEVDYKPAGHSFALSKKSSKKVLIACDYFWPSIGGVELYVAELGVKLQEQNYQVEIATRWLPERKSTQHRGLKIHQFKCDENLSAPITIKTINEFRLLILNGDFDTVIVLTQPDNWVGISMVDLPKPRPNIILLPSINIESIIEWEKTNRVPIISRVLRAADQLVSVSENGYDVQFFKTFGLNYHFIPHAVEQNATPDDFYVTYGFNRKLPLLVMVANFWPVKNHIGLLEHMARFDGEWQFAMIGHPVSHLKEYYNLVVSHAQKDSRVRIISGLPREQAAAAIRDADLLLVPSKGESAGPLVVLQAMSYGTPWIATPECNAVRDEAGGIISALSGFSNIINYLITQPNERKALGQLGQAHWQSCFTWNQTFPSFISLIEGKAVATNLAEAERIKSENLYLQNRITRAAYSPVSSNRDISVIISTFNRSTTLRKCLDALAEQTLGMEKFEVIVCDDGSTDRTELEVKNYQAPYKLLYLKQANKGPASARNMGIRSATGTYLLFINDDSIAEPDLLEQHLHRLIQKQDQRVAVLGKFTLLPDYTRSLFGYTIENSDLLFEYNKMQPEQLHDYRFFYTGNISIARAAVLDVGMFDENFCGPAAEDIELGYRLQKMGYNVFYEPKCIAWHNHELSIENFCKTNLTRGYGAITLYAKHPELCWFKNSGGQIIDRWKQEVDNFSSKINDVIQIVRTLNDVKSGNGDSSFTSADVNKIYTSLKFMFQYYMQKGYLSNPELNGLISNQTRFPNKHDNVNGIEATYP